MTRIAIAVVILTVAFGILEAAGAQQPVPKPTEPASKPKTDEGGPKAKTTPPGNFVSGRVESIRPGNPLVLTLRVVEMSDSVRPLKVEGRLVVELPSAVLRGIQGGAAGIRVGDQVSIDGVVRDGRLVVTRVTVLRGK